MGVGSEFKTEGPNKHKQFVEGLFGNMGQNSNMLALAQEFHICEFVLRVKYANMFIVVVYTRENRKQPAPQ